ncbi:phosphatidylserine decarboxylase family protein [Candidatus Dependentiae bacterium]|nr:phosphatidylserine decarboxylase family protein [Candidatus Dependentiae bacterium]
MLKNNLILLEGKKQLIFAILILFLGFFYKPFFYVGSLIIIFLVFFFRNPERSFEISDESIICPADGTIIEIKNLENEWDKRISIFMSPFDVHINWVPISGKIVNEKYSAGKFKAAFLPKSSELNEHNDIEILDAKGRKILVRQIAGFFARRIVCWNKINDNVEQGQKFGMIKFSSRVDIFVPKGFESIIVLGQRVYGGSTILGKWRK